ncbi:MAG: pilus assembly protein PilM [Dehalococcoidales bacterium]|nr:pilus assembly protein PilM [Dehalococcoidales bacterium]
MKLSLAKKVVTLYIDDTSLRLLVVQGKQVKKWSCLPLEPGLVKSNVIMDENEVATRIKLLFKSQRVRTRKIIVGLSGLHCLTRPVTLPVLPRGMMDEAVMREAKRALPVPLEQLYVSWRIIPAAEGKAQAFIVALPCKTADSVQKTLRLAGLKPYLMDIKPLALARLVKESTAVIVDVQPTEFDIVIIAYGIPQPIRTVPLPSETLSQKEKWQKVKEELDRTINFYNSNNPEKLLGPDVPIFVSGELANRPRLNKTLSEECGFPVLTLNSPLCTEEIDAARYLVNIGLALKEPSLAKNAVTSPVDVNVLPFPYRPKPLPLGKIVAIPGAIVFVGLAVLLTTMVQEASANTTSLRSQLDSTNKMITQKQAMKNDLTKKNGDLQRKLDTAKTSHDSFAAVMDNLEKGHERIDGDLLAITNLLPSTSRLNTIGQSQAGISLQGNSPSEGEALSYARSLESTGRFSEITISNIVSLGNGAMDFSLQIKAKK